MSAVNSFDLTIVWSFLGLLIQLVVFGACVYYAVQKQTTDGFLLAGGSFIHLLSTLFYTIGIRVLSMMNVDIYSNRSVFSIVGFISLVGTICFSTGVIMIVLNYMKLIDDKRINQ